ncbi:transposase [Escherichia coli]|nr:transposase [Escherichia coli]
MPCFTAMRAEIALMSGSAFAVTHHAFSSGAGRTSDGNGSHASTLKSPSYTKSVSWQHYPGRGRKSSVTNYPQDRVTNCPQFWLHYRLQPKKL